jgi:hypothetical protein
MFVMYNGDLVELLLTNLGIALIRYQDGELDMVPSYLIELCE